MDDLLKEFLTETNESLGVVDVELVRFEQDPNNAKILDNIFRLVHTIKGTCGFLSLPRLEALAHAAETLMGKFRDGMPATGEAVTLILATIDRIKDILDALERRQEEPRGADEDLIGQLDRMVAGLASGQSSVQAPVRGSAVVREPALQAQKRKLGPGEATLDELERAFRAAPGPDGQTAPSPASLRSPGSVAAPFAKPTANPVDEPAASAASARTDDADRAASAIVNQSIRVAVDTLEHLMTMVSELVLTRNQLMEIVRRYGDSEFKAPLQRLSNVTAELQESVMKTRMQPVGNAWQKLPRVVRDLASELGKQIEIEMHGGETELDRQVLDLIKDPLTHMVRNSADHALETVVERRAAGKPDKGVIRLSAFHEGGHIVVQISDDGRGLDLERIKARAIANGMTTRAAVEKMSIAQIQRFIFAPGFSTAEKVTGISGRGVGMDVVRNNIEQIGGTIDLQSTPGQGSTFSIKIPLTLAIVSALIVESAGERFAIPQIAVIELVRVHADSERRIERINDTPVMRLRQKLLPLVHLKTLLGLAENVDDAQGGFIVVTQVGNDTFGIVVDGVFHTEEIVVKPMSSALRHIAMFSGNTILGDGAVIMIIDPNGVAGAVGSLARGTVPLEEDVKIHEEAAVEKVSLLVFRAGSPEQKAVPLSLITRLEEIDASKIERSNGRLLIQYRGQLMPLIAASDDVRVKTEGAQSVLVFSDDGRSMGLIVDEIIDIVEERLDVQVASTTSGILGSAVVRGQATEIIDAGHFLPLAFADWFRRKERGRTHAPAILLVDDSPFFRGMLGPVLKAAGYQVTSVAGAQEALELFTAGRYYEAVVTDIDMPRMNGFEFAQILRADARTADIPVIALSSAITPPAIERARKIGFNDFVAKFDRPGLIAALKEQVECLEKAA